MVGVDGAFSTHPVDQKPAVFEACQDTFNLLRLALMRGPMQRRAEQAAAKDARGAGRAGPQRLEFGYPVPATIRCGPLVPRRVGAEAPEGGPLNNPVRPIRSCPMFATILNGGAPFNKSNFSRWLLKPT